MGRRSETGGVTPKGDRIQVRFSYRGEDLRPTLDMKPTAANLKHAKRIREAIVAEIKAGTFSLAEYFPDYKFAEKFEADERGRTFGQWCAVWQQAAARSLEHSTLAIYVRHLSCYWLPEFKDDMPQAITHERVVLRLAKLGSGYFDEISGKEVKPLSRKTQNNILIPLRHVFGMVCKACRGVKDPTEGVDNLKVQVGDPDPFSAAEVAKILPALALVSGADPLWVALQHGHSLEVMLESYAKYIPKADLGRNLAAVNRGITASNSALEPHQKSD